ncbi:MAG: GNAT family N-acetyltransferase [Alphaproteobacteria bacterium]|nr:GNAT family N-acetyltransferase [Alphaproteobacteria bacterium]
MTEFRSALGLPIGFPLPDWKPCAAPPRTVMQGRFCRLEPLDVARHADELFRAFGADTENRIWTYLSAGPFDGFEAYRTWLEKSCLGDDPLYFAVIDLATKRAVGVASYLRIDPANGVVEVGSINYSPALQRTAAGTEAMYLMMKRVFDELGYRRYEWKCDDLNAGSKRAARRYGFTYEGLFRQAVLYKGRNRDTAWFAIIDRDWPGIKSAFETWLAPENLSADGEQKKSLSDFRSG